MCTNLPRMTLSVFAAVVCSACLCLGLASCEPAVRAGNASQTAAADANTTNTNASTSANTNDNASTPSLVAARVEGVSIYEDTITADIQALREDEGVTTAYAWAEWLSTNGYTSESIRDAAIDNYVDVEAVKKAAAEYGVTADEEAIDNLMNQMKSLYTDQEAWNNALAKAGYTEESKRAEFEQASLEQALMDKVTPSDSVDDQQRAFAEWIDNYKNTMDITVYEMPSGLPYAVKSSSAS